MKKLLFVMVAMLGMIACNNNNTSSCCCNKNCSIDSLVVDSSITDSLIDTISIN